jgi:hypothetical protein
MSISRLRSLDDINNFELNAVKAQLLRDKFKLRTESLAPSELREIFSRTKCCEKNCIVTKLRMPLSSATRQPVEPPPRQSYDSLIYCSPSTVQRQNRHGPVTIEAFEHMVWESRLVLESFRVILNLLYFINNLLNIREVTS